MTIRERWRYVCPKGHVSLKNVQSGGKKCKSCGREYSHVIDRKTGKKVKA